MSDEARATTPSDQTGPVSAEEAHQCLQRFVNSHWYRGKPPEGRESARFTIPCDPKRDDDVRLGAYIQQSEARIRELEAIVEKLPVDADGHRIPPGSTVYQPCRFMAGEIEELPRFYCTHPDDDGLSQAWWGDGAKGGFSAAFDLKRVHLSRERAQAVADAEKARQA